MKLVTCNYQGRLGNLMFEIAATLATAWDNDAMPSFPRIYNNYYKDITAFQEYILPIVASFNQHGPREPFAIHHEGADFAYRPVTVTQNTCLNGFFTSSKYFANHRAKIIELFYGTQHQQEVNVVYEKIHRYNPNRRLVSVHVRRTDYVTDYGWALPVEYYRQAAEHFSGVTFLIFSDDHNWCLENLPIMSDAIFINEKDYIELLLIGKCDAHICANSTFSAMGVILGDPEMTKEVIAPRQWIPGVFNKDIVEPHWILI